jgi:hypothetical protein
VIWRQLNTSRQGLSRVQAHVAKWLSEK